MPFRAAAQEEIPVSFIAHAVARLVCDAELSLPAYLTVSRVCTAFAQFRTQRDRTALAGYRAILTAPLVPSAPDVAAFTRHLAQVTIPWRAVTKPILAARLGGNPQDIDELLQRAFDLTFVGLRRLLAVHQAAVLLATTALQAKHISADVGYSHPTALTRDFGRCLGISPTQLRRWLSETS